MAERFVCVGHLVGVFALLDGGTTGLHRVQQFASKTLFHCVFVALAAAVINQRMARASRRSGRTSTGTW